MQWPGLPWLLDRRLVLPRLSCQPGRRVSDLPTRDVDCRLTVRKLKENGIVAAPRQGWVRTSPHFYISPDDVERLIDLL